jgi:DNA polymerase-3 subunit gamma/tau
VLVEMALVRLGRLDDLVSLAQLAQALTTGGPAEPPKTAARPTAVAPRSEPAEALKKKTTAGPGPDTLLTLTAETMASVWAEVRNRLPPMLASQLEKAGPPAITGPNTLALRFGPEYNQHRDHCQRPESTGKIEEVLRKLTGRAWNLRIESAGRDGAVQASVPPERAEAPVPRLRLQQAEAEKEPLLRRAIDVLGAQILRVEEGFGTAPALATEAADEAPTEET